MTYDYFLAGRWRNHENIRPILDALRAADQKVYCFIDNAYDGDDIKIDIVPDDADTMMKGLETVKDWQTNPTFRQIFENDMNGVKESKNFILTFPAGLSAHMELGVAYGLGRKCYGIGVPEKHETLYLMFDEIYPDVESFLSAKVGVKA